MMLQSSVLKQLVYEEGFSTCGIAKAERISADRETEWAKWIANGEQGEMDYLSRNMDKRIDPRLLVEGAKTMLSVALNYYPGEVSHTTTSDLSSFDTNLSPSRHTLHLAKYAYGTDYHEVVKEKLRCVMQKAQLTEGIDGRVFVDTAPIDEKYWAEQAGIGWRGRNSQLIIPGMGSFFFLGEIVLIHEVDKYDEKAKNRCGKCKACLSACPTGALHGDGTLDARKCLSYLTIEHRGNLPEECKDKLNPCIYGCDRCADVCPWNKRFARLTEVQAFQPREAILSMSDEDWKNMTIEQYRELFRKSAVKRAKFEGLKRNISAIFDS